MLAFVISAANGGSVTVYLLPLNQFVSVGGIEVNIGIFEMPDGKLCIKPTLFDIQDALWALLLFYACVWSHHTL